MKKRLPVSLVLFAVCCGFLCFRYIINVRAATTITVNSTADTVSDDGVCTLREAIIASNTDTASGVSVGECAAGSGAGDTIAFNISGGGPYTLTPATEYPNITEQVIIDGYTQSGASANTNAAPAALNGTLQIEIDGGDLVPWCFQLLNHNGSTIRGLVINNFNEGVVVNTSDSDSIEGNYFGTNVAGTAIKSINNEAVTLGDASSVTIGGTDPAERNLISGSNGGVAMRDEDADGNTVIGNIIGLNASGTAALGNATSGVITSSGADNNTIGGTASGSVNVISGNGTSGITVDGVGTTGTIIQGNYVGVGVDGSTALGNAAYGILNSSASSTTIGGTTSSARNILSANTDGIRVNVNSSDITIQGNYIGTDVAGTTDVGNTGEGITIINNGANITVGGSVSGAGNVISGNGNNGVDIDNTNGVIVAGNTIGLASDGSIAMGNDDNGILLTTNATTNTIGGDSSLERNIISSNGQNGILTLSGADSNTVTGNYIGTSSTGLADRGNTSDGLDITTANNVIGGDTSSERNIISGNDGQGVDVSFDTADNNTIIGNYIGVDATGTSALGNSIGITVESDPDSTIIGGDTSGERNIISGNTNQGVNVTGSGTLGTTITGNYIGTNAAGDADLGNVSHGVRTDNNLLDLTIGGSSSGMGNVISGNNQNGISLGTSLASLTLQGNLIGLGADGSTDLGNSVDGIGLGSDGVTVGGTSTGAKNVISGNGGDGIQIDAGGEGNTFLNNYIGTNLTGTAAVSNGEKGMLINGDNNFIGNSQSSGRNVISGNVDDGIQTAISNFTALSVKGNYIGVGSDGATDLGNGGDGIQALTATIGGTNSGDRNIISGNTGSGISISGGSDAVIQGNYIGLNAAGTGAVANGSATAGAINISGSDDCLIGGTSSGARNVISGNATSIGIILIGATAFGGDSATGNIVQGNYIGTTPSGTVESGFGNNIGMMIVLDAIDNVVGGTSTGAGNLIAGNGSGINEFGISGAGLIPLNDSFLGNSVYSNEGGNIQGNPVIVGGINLFDNPTGDFTTYTQFGVNANDVGDPDTNSNHYMNYPVLSTVSSANGEATITYDLDINDSETGATGYRIEFFASDSADSSGNGQGQTYLGSQTVAGDVTGQVATLTLPAGVSGAKYISAVTTMTDSSSDGFGHSSEYSANFLATLVEATGGGGTGGEAGGGSIDLADTGRSVLLVLAAAAACIIVGSMLMGRRRQEHISAGK